jgi:hypothetical protein
MWILHWTTGAPLLNGFSKYPFTVLFFADIPISLPAFAVMFISEERATYAAILWGVLGTVMWYLIGICLNPTATSHAQNRSDRSRVPHPALFRVRV